MSIVYYPTRVYKKVVPAIDRVMAKRNPLAQRGVQNILATALDAEVTSEVDWQVNSISFSFSAATAKNYSATIVQGRMVVEDMNDYLWFQIPHASPQLITLDSGFYTGTELATQLQTQLNANTAFSNLSITFTVAYAAATGLYTITPSSGTVAYLDTNDAMTLSSRQSIAGHLFGLTATTTAAAITSDTAVPGLDSSVPIINETASTATGDNYNYIHTLTMDESLRLATNSGVNVTVNYVVNYEVII